MNFNSRRPRYPRTRLFLLILLFSACAATSQNKKPAASAPAPRAAPAAKPAAAPRPAARPSTPAARPSGGAPNARGGAPSGGANARGGAGVGGAGAKGGTAAGGAGARGGTGAGGANAKGGATAGGANARGGTAAGGANAKGGATAGGANARGGAAGAANAKGGASGGVNGKGGAAGAANGRGGTAAGGANAKGGAAAGKGTAARTPGTVNKPGGGRTVTTKSGNTREYGKSGKVTNVSTKSGHEAKFNSSGRVTAIHTRGGATITHGPRGERRVVGERTNARGEHYRVVNNGRGRGYVAHGYMRGGHPYMRRTYVGYGGRRYAYAYRGYNYRGVAYYGYASPYYYRPAYYGWAYNPWPAPVVYGWGWGAAPWYGYYGPYFAPAPVYPYASLWLADYIIAAHLQAAYEAAAAADANAAATSPDFAPFMKPTWGGGLEFDADAAAAKMSPEIKQMVADDIKGQIEQIKNEAANPAGDNTTEKVPAALDPKHRVFVISAPIDVTVDGDSCTLSAGDIVQRQENEPGSDNAVAVKVLSSKGDDCSAGTTPRVLVTDLQDMHNDFREKLDTGMDTLAKGGNGLPKAPDVTKAANPDGQVQPDLNADDDIKAQETDAEGAEKEVSQAQTDPPGGQ